MELKEVTKQILDIFECSAPEELIGAIRKAITGGNTGDVFDKYVSALPDLSVDWLQRVYQFYLAEREEKKQDYTPVTLSRLVAMLSISGKKETVYDCCCGSGSLSIQRWALNNDVRFRLEELDENVLPVTLFNMAIRNIEAAVVRKDILSGEIFEQYNVVKGEKYGKITRQLFPDTDFKCDAAISNPPFNLRLKANAEIEAELPAGYSCNFAFVANCLRHADRCAVILPRAVFSSNTEAECRKHYVEKGWLQAAIALPGKMFESTDAETCVLLFDKRKTTKDVMLIDASSMGTMETREQRGEGDKRHTSRIYKKNFNVFSDEQLQAVCSLLYKETDGFSRLVSQEQLEEKKYNLTYAVYNPLDDILNHTVIHRDFNKIIKDINRVARERNVLRLTVNKVWAERLGLTEIIKLCEQHAAITKSQNEIFKQFENYEVTEEMIEAGYIRQSNNKVFLIENTDKEQLSSILVFFMEMYKQHIYYLNEEENKLMVELRDSMLPLLISGRLKIKNSEES
jgi:type I restriction-modification system DNA methylase subunit